MINNHPITEVTSADIGRRVSYQISGMKVPLTGTITGLATEVPDSTFVRFDDHRLSVVADLYNMRWGEVEAWLK